MEILQHYFWTFWPNQAEKSLEMAPLSWNDFKIVNSFDVFSIHKQFRFKMKRILFWINRYAYRFDPRFQHEISKTIVVIP